MSGDMLGGGVVVALAAVLWLMYLLPTWLRRREYLTAERNAVRLQQTLRILAETAEMPEEVRVEATARQVSQQQRILKRAQGKADALLRAETRSRAAAEARMQAHVVAVERAQLAAEEKRLANAREVAESAAAASGAEVATRHVVAESLPAPETVTPRRHRYAPGDPRVLAHAVRRTRVATSLLLLVGLLCIAFGVVPLVADGSWVLLVGGVAVSALAVIVLGRLARRTGVRAASAQTYAARVAGPVFDQSAYEPARRVVPTVADAAGWVPRPLPKPLHLSRGTVAAKAMASVDAATQLRRAAARADLEKRAAQLTGEVPVLHPREVPVPDAAPSVASAVEAASDAHAASDAPAAAADVPQRPSRFAGMGVVGDVESSRIDLDEALRRRRAAS